MWTEVRRVLWLILGLFSRIFLFVHTMVELAHPVEVGETTIHVAPPPHYAPSDRGLHVGNASRLDSAEWGESDVLLGMTSEDLWGEDEPILPPPYNCRMGRQTPGFQE